MAAITHPCVHVHLNGTLRSGWRLEFTARAAHGQLLKLAVCGKMLWQYQPERASVRFSMATVGLAPSG